ncbi:MAG: peptide chain release factor N(5)-glutamine methyltransferase [Clostridia bacterium]|nr:peptide chain release factor N(5)-glutamine methyltransferase [Clostridia bacterium]
MTIEENLKIAIQSLKEKLIEEPMLKARLLLCYILGVEKEYLMIHSKDVLESEKEEAYKNAIQKLIQGYPLQYITNHQEFMKLDFYVDENVLIPRADTEVTVEEVISYCKNKKSLKILDLCTGSGAIAISLKKYIPNCEITAVDISKESLEIAKKNAIKNNTPNINWILSDLFEKIEGKFDVIVSNPPYIKKEVILTLDKQVQKEPKLALDGGVDGLDFYRKIIQNAPMYLEKDGVIFLEIGYDQKEEVTNILNETNEYEDIECKKDLAGNDRMVQAKVKR